MRYTEEFLGKAELLSSPTVTASLPTTVIIRYTVGKYGIDERANLKLAWRTVSDWEMPQYTNPTAYGYTTVTTSSKTCKLKCVNSVFERPFHNCIHIKPMDGPLHEGDTITITMGDTSQGSPGIRVQSFVESEHEIKVLNDSLNINQYVALPQSVFINVVAGPINEVSLVAPSEKDVGEEFEMTLRVLDEWGNPCTEYVGEAVIGYKSDDEGAKVELPDKVSITSDDKGFVRFGGCKMLSEGTYYFTAELPDKSLSCVSNPAVCKDNRPYKLFWGDMHAQTSLTIGTGSMDEYYSFGRGPGALDFMGWQGNDFEINEEKWAEVKEKTKEYNEEHKFLTYLGYEWSGNFPGGGDHNVWYLGDDETFYPSSHWTVRSDYNEENSRDRFPLSELFKEFMGRDDVMIIPHIGGRPANLDYYDEFIKNIEIHSHHGTFEWFAHQAMERKLKVGFVASSDDHTCRPGLSYALQNTGQEGNAFDVKSGLVGVYAKELTKKAIWDALQARRCYAATFNRIILDTRIGDALMGEETTVSGDVTVDVKAIGTCAIDHVDLFRGNDLIHTYTNFKEPKNEGRKTVKILWSGVRTTGRNKSTVWDGSITLTKGRICNVEEVAFDTFQQGVGSLSNQMLTFKSSTSGDFDGFILELDAPDDAEIVFSSKIKSFTVKVGDLSAATTTIEAGGINLKIELSILGEYDTTTQFAANELSFSYTDTERDCDFAAYWVKVVQENGQMAYSSPIFVNR